MPDPTQGPPPTSGYVVDAENVAEMARLRRQARMLSEHLGLYPQQLALAQRSHILDIGCGPCEVVSPHQRTLKCSTPLPWRRWQPTTFVPQPFSKKYGGQNPLKPLNTLNPSMWRWKTLFP